MALYPEVQKAAQEELDRVVGQNRLPSFKDRQDLPYINALVKETLRWNPAVPLGQFRYSVGLIDALKLNFKRIRFATRSDGRWDSQRVLRPEGVDHHGEHLVRASNIASAGRA